MSNPVQIDTALAARLSEQATIQARFNYQRMSRESDSAYVRLRYDEREYHRLEAELERIGREVVALEEQYTGWPRYWHVTNANGHIHTSRSCTSCFPDTEFAWRTDLSGLTVEQVVAQEAYNACTVCMPIAPAEQKAARERHTREQQEAKRAEKNAAKQAKARKTVERLEKHIAKVEQAIEQMGGREAFDNDYSLYGHDGRKSVYDFTFDLPAMVGDSLYTLKQEQEEGRSIRDNPYTKLAQAREAAGL
jgi:Skp family chaperone for outer membrane proteins